MPIAPVLERGVVTANDRDARPPRSPTFSAIIGSAARTRRGTVREGRAGRGTRRARADGPSATPKFDERIEHQAATIDVLKAMSASPGDPQPVFDLITRRAANCLSRVPPYTN